MSSHAFELSNPLIVGLDVDTAEECFRLAELLGERVGAFKVGPRLCVRYGAGLITRLSEAAPVFVDNKYLDIPNTMESAIRATFEAGATLATIHCWAGAEALGRLSKVEAELNRIRPFKLLAVTILTSFQPETLAPPMTNQPIASQVDSLADLALSTGITGLVCSVQEVASLRAKSADAFLVTPGVHLPGDSIGDQKRVDTPEVALKRGSSALVVARPICEAADPVLAAERFLDAIKGARA